MSRRIMYILGTFPQLSETFIINELAEIMRQGFEVIPVSMGRRPVLTTGMHELGINLSHKTVYTPTVAAIVKMVMFRMVHNPRTAVRLLKMNILLPCLPAVSKFKRFLKCIAVLEQIHKFRPEHLHAHWTVSSDVAMILSEITDIPFSFSAHAHDIYVEGPLYDSQSPGLGLSYKISKSKFTATCTDYNRRHLASLCSQDFAKRVYTVYHGVDTDNFRPGSRSGGIYPTILSVGRIIAYKGFDRLLRVCNRLRGAGYRFRCLIVGDGSQRQRLIQEATENGLEDVVIFLGPKTAEEVQRLYAEADIFVLAASLERGQYGLPNVLVEAASAGLATVTTNLPCVEELIENGRSGLIVDDNEDALLAGLEKLMRDPYLRLKLGDTAARVARSRFTLDRNIRVLGGLFNDQLYGV